MDGDNQERAANADDLDNSLDRDRLIGGSKILLTGTVITGVQEVGRGSCFLETDPQGIFGPDNSALPPSPAVIVAM